MDICLHYKNDQEKENELTFVTKRLLQDFPTRVLPAFTPWFPSGADASLPIKPKKAPPVILLKESNCSEYFQQRSESDCLSHSEGQEKTGGTHKRKLITSPEDGEGDLEHVQNVAKICKRSWSVFSPKMKTTERTQSFSRLFQKTILRYGLHLHQRAKWIICKANCVPQSIEDVWSRLTHAIKHSMLPTCNANFQRKLVQIWVYCDIIYSENTGRFLKQKFQLSGEITLAVHKLGDIFKL